MMASEFHGLELACSPSSIIPEGLNYSDIAFQSCAIAGSTPGSLTVSGDSYIAASFSYSYDNVWPNFAIMLLFTITFILLGAFFNEVFEWNESGAGGLEFKASGATKAQKTNRSRDEEEKPVDSDFSSPTSGSSHQKVDLTTDKSTFTWKDLTFTIPYDGSTRTLLNKVSGYCAPGQMTALVGSSGAGKSTRESLLPLFCYMKLTKFSVKHSSTTATYWTIGWPDVIGWKVFGKRFPKEDWFLRADGHS